MDLEALRGFRNISMAVFEGGDDEAVFVVAVGFTPAHAGQKLESDDLDVWR